MHCTTMPVVVTAIAMLKKWNAMEQTLSSISLAHLPCSERIISLFLRHPIKSPNKYLNDSSSKPKNATHSAIAKFLPDNQFLFVMRGYLSGRQQHNGDNACMSKIDLFHSKTYAI